MLILFLPFRNEMEELHQKDVFELYDANGATIKINSAKYEKMEGLTKLLEDIDKDREERNGTEVVLQK